jgi:hypothetical protein
MFCFSMFAEEFDDVEDVDDGKGFVIQWLCGGSLGLRGVAKKFNARADAST